PSVSWNLSTWGKKRAFTKGMEVVAEMIDKRTGGKFKIKIHYGEALSKARENLDGIKIGAFQMAQFCNFYHPGKNPAWMVFSLPFLALDDWEVSRKVRIAMLKHPALVADMARWNAIPYKSGLLPQYEFLGRGTAPAKLEDWKGRRVRAGGGLGDAMRKLGAVLTTVPATEVFTSIERGTMDAASMPYTYAHAAYQIHTVTTWFTSNMSPGTSECAAVINKDAYAKLPPQYRQLLQDVLPAAYDAQIKAYKDIDAKNLPMFRAKLKEVKYSAAELKRFADFAGKPVWDKWVDDNKGKFDSKGVLTTILAEIEKARGKK
ncbi:MAG: C4-dicarboxylate TRAP transporter substrate-binding protein, partial [Hyphomicrobiaceae bacterium]|nr:C4-dicarboxylate TRAP transporter substrate-binding protein [Hyphomicrobiaceae bacterium]